MIYLARVCFWILEYITFCTYLLGGSPIYVVKVSLFEMAKIHKTRTINSRAVRIKIKKDSQSYEED